MDRRAQGAMEYLMSYGWAILVIMAVGGAMWQLGILNVGGSVPATAAGFQALKPLIATCEMTNEVYDPGVPWNGFTCQFVNEAGGDILIKDVNVTVDGRYCDFPVIDIVPIQDLAKSFLLWRSCDVACLDPTSFRFVPLQACPVANTPNCYIPVPNGEQFSVFAFTQGPVGDGDPCSGIVDGRVYTVDVDITYELVIGGVTATKGSSGKIRLPGRV